MTEEESREMTRKNYYALMRASYCDSDGNPDPDFVYVIRCRDCEYWEIEWKPNHSIDGEHFCPMISLVTSGEWFCAYGERREEK